MTQTLILLLFRGVEDLFFLHIRARVAEASSQIGSNYIVGLNMIRQKMPHIVSHAVTFLTIQSQIHSQILGFVHGKKHRTAYPSTL